MVSLWRHNHVWEYNNNFRIWQCISCNRTTCTNLTFLDTRIPNLRTLFLAVDKYVSLHTLLLNFIYCIHIIKSFIIFFPFKGDDIQILGQRKDQGYVQYVFTVSKCYVISKYDCGELYSYQKWLDKSIFIVVGTASSIRQIPDTITIHKYWFYFISKKSNTRLCQPMSMY